MNPVFWKGKRVFLSGHTGFKGSWLSLWLQKAGAVVYGYSLKPPTNPSLFEQARVEEGMTSQIADIRDLDVLSAAIAGFKPDVVIHMAAQPLVRLSYSEPVETYQTNVMGTVNLLESVRRAGGVRVVINITSDKCYENREWVWGYRENDPMGGYDPYSNSKGCAELVSSAYRNSFFNPDNYDSHGVALGSVRAGNVIGGGDWAMDRLVPDIIRSMIAGESVTIRNPQAIRPWQHVLEPLGGYLLLAENLWESASEFSGGWNFGPKDEDARNVQWIVEQMTIQWGEQASWERDQGPQPHEANYLKLDCSKANLLLHWQPKWSLHETLRRIVAWHKAQISGADMRDYCLQEICEYEQTTYSK